MKNVLNIIVKKAQIYNGKLSVVHMFEHLLKLELFFCSRGRLYFYNEPTNRYILIDKSSEWHYVSCFFSKEICTHIMTDDISEILKRLKLISSIQISIDDFNNHPELINVLNGVLDYQTGVFVDPNPEIKFTYQLNVKYLPDVSIEDAPNFKEYCDTSLDGDEAKIHLLLQIIGYLVSPLIEAKKACVLLGQPDSGKSLILHLMEYIIGSEFISNIPLENLGKRFKTAVLSTKLLNICGELSAKPLRDIEIFKMVVGGDTLSGEFKGRDEFEFKNKCKLVFAGNILPPVKNEDISTAFVDRLVILNFSHSIPEKERKRGLKQALELEADVIFSLAIKALNDLIANNYIFDMPDDSKNLLSGYAFQQSHIDTFVSDWCELRSDYKIHSATLYASYREFCKENAISPISQNMFSQKIGSLPGVTNRKFRLYGSNPARGFYGIGLKKDTVQDSDSYYKTDDE